MLRELQRLDDGPLPRRRLPVFDEVRAAHVEVDVVSRVSWGETPKGPGSGWGHTAGLKGVGKVSLSAPRRRGDEGAFTGSRMKVASTRLMTG